MSSAMSRGLTVGVAAESHERFRLGYPDEVVDRTLRFVGRRVTDAVEVGAGTGKATRAFASRGITVQALEPDPHMFGVLRRETVGMSVRPVLLDLESYLGPRTDLVYAASSWHWTDPETRAGHAARLLTDGGVLAVFDSPMTVADPRLRDLVAAVAGSTLDEPVPDVADELRSSGKFAEVVHVLLDRRMVLPKREYVGYLTTLPPFLLLTTEQRQDLLRGVVEVVPDQVPVDLTVGLHLARRRVG